MRRKHQLQLGKETRIESRRGVFMRNNSWENFFINTENRDETVQMLVESVQKCLDIILANNSEDGTHPKAVFGFRDGLPDVKKSFARWTFPKKWSSIEEVTKLFFW
jgi:hypothetical protein